MFIEVYISTPRKLIPSNIDETTLYANKSTSLRIASCILLSLFAIRSIPYCEELYPF